jgi:hypothetical protein
LVIGISGCGDIKTPYYVHIDNCTDDTIRITIFEKPPYQKEMNLEIPPKGKGIIFDQEVTARRNECKYILIYEGEVDIQTSSGRTLTKEIWDVNNWICKGSFKGGWERIFVITEDDLE